MWRESFGRGRANAAARLALARQLRRDATPMERHAWSLLRNRGILNLKFRRQYVLGPFIVDFYCPRLRLVLELDGAPHDEPGQAGYDGARTERLGAFGYRVIRVRNRDVTREAMERLLAPLVRRRKLAR